MVQKNEPRDIRGELEKDDGTFGETWKPGPGDILTGTIRGYREAVGNYGPVVIATVEEDKTGTRYAVWLSATVLRNEFAKQKPRVGESVGIRYYGTDPVKNYHRYRLVVDRPEVVPDFGGSTTDDEAGNWQAEADLSQEAEHGTDTDPPF